MRKILTLLFIGCIIVGCTKMQEDTINVLALNCDVKKGDMLTKEMVYSVPFTLHTTLPKTEISADKAHGMFLLESELPEYIGWKFKHDFKAPFLDKDMIEKEN